MKEIILLVFVANLMLCGCLGATDNTTYYTQVSTIKVSVYNISWNSNWSFQDAPRLLWMSNVDSKNVYQPVEYCNEYKMNLSNYSESDSSWYNDNRSIEYGQHQVVIECG